MDENMVMNEEVTVNTDEIDNVETTDLVANDSGDSEGGIGGLEVAIGGLAVVGGVFLVKKSVDGVKWCYGKLKDAKESWSEKRAAKKAAKDRKDDEPIDSTATEVPEEAAEPEDSKQEPSKDEKK